MLVPNGTCGAAREFASRSLRFVSIRLARRSRLALVVHLRRPWSRVFVVELRRRPPVVRHAGRATWSGVMTSTEPPRAEEDDRTSSPRVGCARRRRIDQKKNAQARAALCAASGPPKRPKLSKTVKNGQTRPVCRVRAGLPPSSSSFHLAHAPRVVDGRRAPPGGAAKPNSARKRMGWLSMVHVWQTLTRVRARRGWRRAAERRGGGAGIAVRLADEFARAAPFRYAPLKNWRWQFARL